MRSLWGPSCDSALGLQHLCHICPPPWCRNLAPEQHPGSLASSGALRQIDGLNWFSPVTNTGETEWTNWPPTSQTRSNGANLGFEPHQADWRHPSGLKKTPEEPWTIQTKHPSRAERWSAFLPIWWIQLTIPTTWGTSLSLSAVITPDG